MLQEQIELIKSLYKDWKGNEPDSIEKIPQSGSDRVYFRIKKDLLL